MEKVANRIDHCSVISVRIKFGSATSVAELASSEIRKEQRGGEGGRGVLGSRPSTTEVLFVFQAEREIPFDSERVACCVSFGIFLAGTARFVLHGMFSVSFFFFSFPRVFCYFCLPRAKHERNDDITMQFRVSVARQVQRGQCLTEISGRSIERKT